MCSVLVSGLTRSAAKSSNKGLGSRKREYTNHPRWVCSRGYPHAGFKPLPPKSEIPTDTTGTAIVIGGGVSGLIAALGLAQFGMVVHVRFLSVSRVQARPLVTGHLE
jgi:hypothetical protein